MCIRDRPADPGGQVAAVTQRRRVLIERALDAPVMRHVQRAPAGVVEAGLIGAARVALVEQPAVVERRDRAHPPAVAAAGCPALAGRARDTGGARGARRPGAAGRSTVAAAAR